MNISFCIILGPNNWAGGPPGGMTMPTNMGSSPMMCSPGMGGMTNVGQVTPMGPSMMGNMTAMPAYGMGQGMYMGTGDPSMTARMYGPRTGPTNIMNANVVTEAAGPPVNQNLAYMNPNVMPGMTNIPRMTNPTTDYWNCGTSVATNNWPQQPENFGTYQQNYGGGPMRSGPVVNSVRNMPYSAGKKLIKVIRICLLRISY